MFLQDAMEESPLGSAIINHVIFSISQPEISYIINFLIKIQKIKFISKVLCNEFFNEFIWNGDVSPKRKGESSQTMNKIPVQL